VSTSPTELQILRQDAPLVLSLPHTGTEIPAQCSAGLTSLELARRDTDWWIHELYSFARELGATTVRTPVSRTVIDVNRDPDGLSLYPGQATTELCPTTTFDGEPLYQPGATPNSTSIAQRRQAFHEPYHAALRSELTRLQSLHPRVVLYDCHSIRSRIPRLFEGELPIFNLGTFNGASCAPSLTAALERIGAASNYSWITNGRFKGGYITRHYGDPQGGVHAVQMELACRGYLREPANFTAPHAWPVAYATDYAAPLQQVLRQLLQACIDFAKTASA
jgi:N-formylglutamate deformylase